MKIINQIKLGYRNKYFMKVVMSMKSKSNIEKY